MSLDENVPASDEEDFVDELKPGTPLMHGQYVIEGFLAAGGFGITYLAKDSLGRPIVIKECFPGSFCRRQGASVAPRSRAHQNELKSIVRLFSNEAKSLAKAKHPNIVGVHQIFEENNTAYMALDFVQGRDLLEILQDEPDFLTPERIQEYLTKVLDAIKHVHDLGMLHRDISPDNIIIDADGEPILIDFGAARESTNERVTRMLSALRVVKDGYSPQEFYIAGSEQTPSCDLYSLAASFYHLATRELPPDSQLRLSSRAAGDTDPYVSLGDKVKGYPKRFVSGLDKAMSILPNERMQSADEWLAHLDESNPISKPSLSLKQVSSIGAASVAAASQGKKSMMPLLMGSTAAVAVIGAAVYFTSLSGSDEPGVGAGTQDVAVTNVQPKAEPILPVENQPILADVPQDAAPQTAPETDPEPTVVVEAEPITEPANNVLAEVAPVTEAEPEVVAEAEPVVEPAEEVQVAQDDVQPEIADDLGDESLDVASLPAEAVGAADSPDLSGPIETVEVEEVLPATRPAPRIIAAAPVAEAPPSVDTVAPSQDTTEVAEAPEADAAEAQEPQVEVAENQVTTEEGNQMLDFFMAMQPSDGVSAQPDVARAAPVVTASVDSAPENAAPAPTVTRDVSPAGAGNPSVISRYVSKLPFTLSESEPGVIASVAAGSPALLSENTRIVSINRQPMTSNAQIEETIQTLGDAETDGSFEVIIGFETGVNGTAFDSVMTVKKEHHTLLLNGLRFVSRQNGTRWTTEVAEAPAASNFKVGDELMTYIVTYEDLDGPETLKTILERELSGGASSFNFAIKRDGETWIEAFTLASLDQ